MKPKLLNLIAVIMLLLLCNFLKSCAPNYAIRLSSVESPADARQQFGETKVVNFKEGNISKYRYSDDYIDIVWFVSSKHFNFELINKSNHTIKINWDDVSYVDVNGKTGRVMHAGVKYIDRNSSQPATSIPKKAKISDLLLPTDNVYLIPGQYGGWNEKDLISSKDVGKKMIILMPIVIHNIQNDYIFEFKIDALMEPTK